MAEARKATGRLETPARRYPVGVEVIGNALDFRVWAPGCREVEAVIEGGEAVPLEREDKGYFSGRAEGLGAGTLYRYRLDGRGPYPDPVSRFQPDGPHGPSMAVDPSAFAWSEHEWHGVSLPGQVLYEIHVGSFTPEGSWAAAAGRLEQLADLGITTVELMPVAEFPGRFGWGYDGVDLFAPSHLYGSPDDFRAFVDRAHAVGLGVILDVVYNHLGPDGNFLPEFAPAYFTDRYDNEWGEAVNFDGPDAGPVREFVLTNAAYWIQEFRLDGLRVDATQQMFDASPRHILAEITHRVREAGRHRATLVIAENEPQQVRLVQPVVAGGFGMDGLWNDDFHHAAMVAAAGRHHGYYHDHRGRPQEFVSAAKYGFLFQGQYYEWQKKARGTPTFHLSPAHFVNYLQNHDQVANSARGDRLHRLTSPGRYRALTALLLLLPGTPLLFQGQEFAASAPFLYFADHRPELARAVAAGRADFLGQFPSLATPEMRTRLADPSDPATFRACKLDFSECEGHRPALDLHRDLIRLRRDDPVFALQRPGVVDGAVLGDEAFCLRFFGEDSGDRLVLVNLGRDLTLSPAPEPLLAPRPAREWRPLWSSEHPRYGGGGTAWPAAGGPWTLPAHSALVMTSHGDAGE